MKDEEVKKATQSDDEGKAAENGELVRMDGDDSHAAIVNSNGKSRNKANRKRRGSTSPEEDIIDGFAISSYSSLEALESKGPSKPELLVDGRRSHKSSKRSMENGINGKKRKSEKRRSRMHHDPKPKDTDSEDEAGVERKKPEGSWFPPKREKGSNTSDDNSDSASSDKGYWCDTESEGERMSDNESTTTSSAPNSSLLSVKTTVSTTKPSSTEMTDKEAEKSVPKPSEWTSSTSSSFSTVTTQRPSSHGSSSASTSLHLALTTTTTMSHPMTPTFGHAHHGSLFPHFPSFHPHPGAIGYPHGPPPGESPFPYPSNAPGFRHGLHMTSHHPPPLFKEEHLDHRGWGPEFLRHELNNRFLQSQAADRVPPGMSPSQLMHYESHQHHHQHLHQHQHQHQHFHSNGAPVATPQLGIPPVGSYSPVPPPLIPKKPGKWCAAHVQTAWQIYYHQQKVQAELHKDPHVKPDQVPISRSGTCLSLHSRPSNHEAPPYHVHGPGAVSPVATPAIPAAAGPFLTGTPIPTAHSTNHGIAHLSGGSVGIPAAPPAIMGLGGSPVGGLRSGLGASISSPFRSIGNSSFSGLGSSLGLGSSFSSVHGVKPEWNRMSSSPASYHSWLSRETEREKERENERERERERDRERERERERDRERDRSSDRDQDRDKERGIPDARDRGNLLAGKIQERERASLRVSDEEGDSSQRLRDRDKPVEGRRSPIRHSHSTGFNIASLTSTEPKPETSSAQEMRSSFERERSLSTSATVSSVLSSGRREEPKLPGDRRSSEDHDLVILSSDRHSGGHSHGVLSFMDKRSIYEDRDRPREPFDLARFAVRPPVPHRIGLYPPPHAHPHPYSLPHSHAHPHIAPPSLFAHGGSLANPYLGGSAMSAVTHPPAMPGFLPPRGMLGLTLPGLGPRSRSPGDVVAAEHARTASEILLAAAPEGRP